MVLNNKRAFQSLVTLALVVAPSYGAATRNIEGLFEQHHEANDSTLDVDSHRELQDDFPGADFPWISHLDIPGAVRSPCPVINTLANHGIINRDGKDVTMTDLAAGLAFFVDVTEGFLLNGPIATVISRGMTNLVDGADPGSTDPADHMFPISNLFLRNPGIIHDASLVRTDTYFCADEEFRPNNDLVDGLLNLRPESDVITMDDLNDYQRERILDTLKFNGTPNIKQQLLNGQGGLSVQKGLIMVIGQADDLMSIPKAWFESIFRNERVPEGYKPRGPLFSFSNGDLAMIRREQFRARIIEDINTPVVATPVAQNADCQGLPYSSIISNTNTGQGDKRCSAALIAPDIAVTAAHCVDVGDNLRIGYVNDDWAYETIKVAEVMNHPNAFGSPGSHQENLPNDIAVIRLERDACSAPIAVNTVSAIPSDNTQRVSYSSAGATEASGSFSFGVREEDHRVQSAEFHSTLQKVETTTTSFLQCSRDWKSFQPHHVSNLMEGVQFCVDTNGEGGGPCDVGAAGTPLTYTDGDGNIVLVGLGSQGMCDAEVPPYIFTRIAFYALWIDRAICELGSVYCDEALRVRPSGREFAICLA